jgi:hypothetical protein
MLFGLSKNGLQARKACYFMCYILPIDCWKDSDCKVLLYNLTASGFQLEVTFSIG